MGNSSRLQETPFKSFGVVLLALLLPALVEGVNDSLGPTSRRPCPGTDPRMNGTHEKWFGQDVVWQIPPNPKAILFMAHGGFKEPLSYFDPGPNCKQCYGLPEDRTVVLEALTRGYAVLTLKSHGISGYDTFPIETSKDLELGTRLIPEWTTEHSLEGLPLFAWGHSAGGYFVSALTLKLQIAALVLMCIEGTEEVENFATRLSFPPTFFARMPVDDKRNRLIIHAMALLRERGVAVAGKECWPKALSPLFFTERIRCMTDEMSEKVYWAYKAAGWLDSNDFLVESPHDGDWEAVLRNADALPVCNETGDLFLALHVLQELHMAFACHSLTSDANTEIYSWLDSMLPHYTELSSQLPSSSA